MKTQGCAYIITFPKDAFGVYVVQVIFLMSLVLRTNLTR